MTPRDADVERLRQARGFVFDLDGTLVLGNKRNEGLQVLDGSAEFLALLAEHDVPFVVLTNGTARPPEAYEYTLTAAGLPVPASRIMTPASVAAEYFAAAGMRRVLVLGVEGVWKPLRDAGLDVVVPGEEALRSSAPFDAVFVGWYHEFLLDDIEVACEAVWNGAKLFAASLVPFFATRGGRALGSSRAVCAMITSVTDVEPVPIGKPSPIALSSAARRLSSDPSELVVVGDDPALETRMALDGGALAVAVHSGVAADDDFAALPSDRRPHLDVGTIADLLRIYAEVRA